MLKNQAGYKSVFFLTKCNYRILFYECFVGENFVLLVAAVEFGGGQDVAEGAEPVEQHGAELDQDDGEEKEDQDDTDRLQVKVFDGNDDLLKRET